MPSVSCRFRWLPFWYRLYRDREITNRFVAVRRRAWHRHVFANRVPRRSWAVEPRHAFRSSEQRSDWPQQIVESFLWTTAPAYLARDNDDFREVQAPVPILQRRRAQWCPPRLPLDEAPGRSLFKNCAESSPKRARGTFRPTGPGSGTHPSFLANLDTDDTKRERGDIGATQRAYRTGV
jgi:hypothetical protein